VDDRSRGALTAAGLQCGSCGTELPPNSKFCNECGAPVTQVSRSAEYKQVTVLFADVVHSMDIAAAVGAERLREIMAELADRCAAVVQRYRGTVDKFTGDGIMAVFGAPVALEDHAIRACLAALGIQDEAPRLATEVRHLAAAAARTAGRGSGRRHCLPRVRGSLPRHGYIARLRGTYDVGRGDAMTAAKQVVGPRLETHKRRSMVIGDGTSLSWSWCLTSPSRK
jgi:hypothetical protein